MSFDYEMSADPSKALGASAQVERSLVGVEQRARIAGSSITAAFGDRARDAAGRLVASTQALARGFAGIADAIEAELRTLERLNGANRQLEKDLVTIESLFRQGKVSAAQYADEMERIARAAPDATAKGGGDPRQAASMIGFDQPYSKTGKLLNGLTDQFLGGLGAFGVAGAIGGIAIDALKSWDEYNQKIQGATNSLVKFFDTQEAASNQLGRFKELAGDLREGLQDTIQAFNDVEGATSKLYLTTQEQIEITTNLGKTIKADGSAIGAIAPVLQTIEFAMERGTISGGELQKMMKQFPPLSQVWQQEFGTTTKGLIDMANAGKLNGDQIGRLLLAFREGSDATKKFDEQIKVTADDLYKMGGSEGFDGLLRGMNVYMDSLDQATEKQRGWATEIHAVTLALQKQHDQIEANQRRAAIATSSATDANLAIAVGRAIVEMREQQSLMALITNKEGAESMRQFEALERLHKAGAIDTLSYNMILDKLRGTLNDTAKEAKSLITEADKLRALLATGGAPSDSWFTWAKKDVEELRAEFQKMGEEVTTAGWLGSLKLADAPGLGEVDIDHATKVNEQQRKMAEDLEQAQEFRELLANQITGAVSGLSSQLVEAAHGAEGGWKNFGESLLKTFEQAIVQALILRAITGSVSGAANSAGGYGGLLGLLGFGGKRAMGGTYTAQGSGGTDSIPVLFMMSPGEQAEFTPRGASRRGGTAGDTPSMVGRRGGAPDFRVVNVIEDGRSLLSHVDSNHDGDRVMFNNIRRGRSAYKSLLQ